MKLKRFVFICFCWICFRKLWKIEWNIYIMSLWQWDFEMNAILNPALKLPTNQELNSPRNMDPCELLILVFQSWKIDISKNNPLTFWILIIHSYAYHIHFIELNVTHFIMFHFDWKLNLWMWRQRPICVGVVSWFFIPALSTFTKRPTKCYLLFKLIPSNVSCN